MMDRVDSKPHQYDIIPVPGHPNRVEIVKVADGITEVGTPLNKATLLSDETAGLFGLSGDQATVDNGLAKLFSKFKTEIPIGLIVMWSGTISSIPANYALCDGTKNTPDLRDKFVLGAGGVYNVGATGGEKMHKLTVSEMPSHGHSIPVADGSGRDQPAQVVGASSANGPATSNAGGDASHNNMPPYYALAYIMRIS